MLETMAINNHQWPTSRLTQRNRATVNGVGARDTVVAALETKVDVILQALGLGNGSVNAIHGLMCELCGGSHNNSDCQAEQVSYVNQNQNNNMYSNTYNPAWRNQPNFSYKNNQNVLNPPVSQGAAKNRSEPSMYEMLKALTLSQTETDAQIRQLTASQVAMQNESKQFMVETRTGMRNLENQVGQLARKMEEREPGTFPTNAEINSRQVHAIKTRSKKQIAETEADKEKAKSPTEKSNMQSSIP